MKSENVKMWKCGNEDPDLFDDLFPRENSTSSIKHNSPETKPLCSLKSTCSPKKPNLEH